MYSFWWFWFTYHCKSNHQTKQIKDQNMEIWSDLFGWISQHQDSFCRIPSSKWYLENHFLRFSHLFCVFEFFHPWQRFHPKNSWNPSLPHLRSWKMVEHPRGVFFRPMNRWTRCFFVVSSHRSFSKWPMKEPQIIPELLGCKGWKTP